MPIPNNCIVCDKTATLVIDKTPYCVKHYREEKAREEKDSGF